MNSKISKVELSLLDNTQEHLWDDFLARSINYTFYQDLKFIDFYSYKVNEVKKILFRKNDRILALLPAGVCEQNGIRQLQAPFSASFGGFCYTNELKLQEALEIIEVLLDYCRAQRISKVSIKQTPQIYYKVPNEYMEFALVSHGFEACNSDLTLFVECQKDPLNRFGSTARNIIRRSIKEGFKLEITEDISDVFNLIESNKQNKGLTLSVTREELVQLQRIFKKRIKLCTVKAGRELVSSAVIYLLGNQTMLVMFWAQRDDWAKKSPTYFCPMFLA